MNKKRVQSIINTMPLALERYGNAAISLKDITTKGRSTTLIVERFYKNHTEKQVSKLTL